MLTDDRHSRMFLAGIHASICQKTLDSRQKHTGMTLKR